MSKVAYQASYWDFQDFCIGKTKRRLYDRKTEHLKAITGSCHASVIAHHVTPTLRKAERSVSRQGHLKPRFYSWPFLKRL